TFLVREAGSRRTGRKRQESDASSPTQVLRLALGLFKWLDKLCILRQQWEDSAQQWPERIRVLLVATQTSIGKKETPNEQVSVHYQRTGNRDLHVRFCVHGPRAGITHLGI